MEDVNDTIISTPATTDALDEDLVLDLREVTLVRDGRTLLHPVTWQVEVDERWIIIGPNGAGKTSLLTIAGAREYPSSGSARIVGETLGRTDVRELRTAVGMSSAAVSHQIPGDERVLDLVVSAGYDVMGRWREVYESADEVRAMEILEQMGALHLGDQVWGTLSEGERKRVLIARALMTDPELLLLDEPGAGLDLGGREDLVSMLGELAADPDAPAMVMVTHHVEEIPPGYTHVALLREGGVVAAGPIEETLTSQNLTRTFGLPLIVEQRGERYTARSLSLD